MRYFWITLLRYNPPSPTYYTYYIRQTYHDRETYQIYLILMHSNKHKIRQPKSGNRNRPQIKQAKSGDKETCPK